MGQISYTIPTAGSAFNSIADPEISTALQTLLTWANGNVDATNLGTLLAQSAAVNQSGQTVKGSVNIAATETRSNVAYGTLTTPDQVTGIVLPNNGLIQVWYQAQWQESVAGAARAAIFIGANQLQGQSHIPTTGPQTQAAYTGSVAATAILLPLFTTPIGLLSPFVSNSYSADVTTGQIVGFLGDSALPIEIGGANHQISAGSYVAGGPCCVFASAGTYTISVQFKASSGSVTAQNRKLWVQALSFA